MEIALDVTYASPRERYGIGRYSSELARALVALDPENSYHLCYRPSYLLRGGRFLSLRQANVHHRILEAPFTWWFSRRIDLFHSLNLRLPRQRFRSEIITLHDVYALTERVYATEDFRRTFARLTRESVARARHILVPSNYLKQELLRTCTLAPEKISVVPLGVELEAPELSLEEREELERSIGPGGPVLLAVGNLERRKNFSTIAQVLRRLPREVRVVQAGGMGFGAEEILRAVEVAGVRERFLRLGYCAPPKMRALYGLASALLFPSLEETFGMPVLEAMAAGLPVIASRGSALPEVAGDAALLVDPEDPEEMAAAVRRVLAEESRRADLIGKGRARAQQFPWSRTARETLAVYRRVVES